MTKRLTMYDVAKAVGVHASTVSRALDPKTSHRISPDVVARVHEVTKRLGFVPNISGTALRSNRSQAIGVIVPDITDPIFPPIIRGLEDVFSQWGYAAILANTDGDEEREAKVIASLMSRSVEGLVIASSRYHDRPLKKLKGLPVVTVIRWTDDPTVPSVCYDEGAGLRYVLTHLASLGHRRIAEISGPQEISTGLVRHQSFERTRREMKMGTDRKLVVYAQAFNEQEGERCTEQLLSQTSDFSAIVCANDRLAVGAIDALRRHGMQCPNDISVVGFNDMPYVDRLVPALTTVRVPQYKAGYEAAKYLIEAVRQPASSRPESKRIVLPVELVVRSSTGPVRDR
jgi:LacI family transcriptional regulator